MHYRLANLSDYKALANIHCRCASRQGGGFMYQLGELFFREYYRTFLREPWMVIVCAVDEHDKIVGFNSATFRAEEHTSALRRRAFWLGLAAMPAVFTKSSLLWQCWLRMKSLSARGQTPKYGVGEGPRGDYWAWLPDVKDPVGAVEMHKKLRLVMAVLGAESLKAEVDSDNQLALKSQLLLGAKIVSTFKTPDGRERCVLEFDLRNWK